MTIEWQPDGRVKITYNLTTIWVSDAEATAAATDHDAAAAIFRRLAR